MHDPEKTKWLSHFLHSNVILLNVFPETSVVFSETGQPLTCVHAGVLLHSSDPRLLVRLIDGGSETLVASSTPDDLRARPGDGDLSVQRCLGNSSLEALQGAGLL